MDKLFAHLRNQWAGVLALFLVLAGGTAWAATELDKNEVKSKHIGKGQVKNGDLARGAVTSPKVANGSLLGEDFAPGELLQGQTGPPGPEGPAGSPDSPQQVLGKLRQVDGNGSGLDADQVDGVDSGVLHRTKAGGRTLVDAGTLPASSPASRATVSLSMGDVEVVCADTNALHSYNGEEVDIWVDDGYVEPSSGAFDPDSVTPFHYSTTGLSGPLGEPDDRMTYFIFSATHVAEVELLGHYSGSNCRYLIVASEYRR
jgi:hypothetical protein